MVAMSLSPLVAGRSMRRFRFGDESKAGGARAGGADADQRAATTGIRYCVPGISVSPEFPLSPYSIIVGNGLDRFKPEGTLRNFSDEKIKLSFFVRVKANSMEVM